MERCYGSSLGIGGTGRSGLALDVVVEDGNPADSARCLPMRCFGLGLCRWKGLPAFRAWVQSAVFAHNLARLV